MSGLLPDLAPSGASSSRTQLRLVDGLREEPSRALPGFEPAPLTDMEVPSARGHVLVVGIDAEARTHMLDELREVLPSGARFVETEETWEALALAEGSQMAVLVGDLEELSGASLARLLARRQPTLPVLTVSGEASSAHPSAASG
jgi:hypothetical protein